jgi:hypothetical protein
MKKIIVVQITLLILFSGALGGMLVSTNVYDEVQRKIVIELCLSCIKLKPNTIKEYRFETANGKPHPDFIVENLSKGPVILDYRITFCPGCNYLEEFVLSKIFNYTFRDPLTYPDDPDLLIVEKQFKGTNITFIHIHTGDIDSKDVPIDGIIDKSRNVYDNIGDAGNPMLVFITYGYNHGFIEPYYCTIYDFAPDYHLYETESYKYQNEVTELIHELVDLYNEHKGALD